MNKRKETPDILGDLLGGQPTELPQEPAKKQDSKPAMASDGQQAEEPESEQAEKIKATYYLTLETLDRLEDGWLTLRRLADREQRTSISKSQIIETALQIALEGLEQQGPQSELAGRILES